MNDGAYAGLRRTARAAAPGAQSEDQDRAEPKGKADPNHEEQYMTEEEHKAALAEATAKAKAEGKTEGETAAQASERDRVKAVAAAVAEDEACKGKADIALSMLADDDYAGLSASGIVKLLGKQAVTTFAADAGDKPDPEAAARAEMKEVISQTQNSNVDAGGGAGPADKKAQADSVWDHANAAVGRTKKEA